MAGLKKMVAAGLCALLALLAPAGCVEALAAMEVSAGGAEVRTQAPITRSPISPLAASLSSGLSRLSSGLSFPLSSGLTSGIGTPAAQAAVQAPQAAALPALALPQASQGLLPPPAGQESAAARPGSSLGALEAIQAVSRLVTSLAQSAQVKNALSAEPGRQEAGLKGIFAESLHPGRLAASEIPADSGPEAAPLAPSMERQRPELLEWAASEQKTMVVAHSMSYPKEILAGITGIEIYEIRMLSQVLAAADKNVHVIFLTSTKVDEALVDHLLRSRPDRAEVRSRIKFIHLGDARPEPLSKKLLEPAHRGTLEEIKRAIEAAPGPAALFPFISTKLEWDLAGALGLGSKVFGAHPSLEPLADKSGNHRVFRAVGLEAPDAELDIRSVPDLVRGIDALWARNPGLQKMMVKLNVGASGIGNATLTLPPRSQSQEERLAAIEAALPHMEFVSQTWDSFRQLIPFMGGLVEAFVDGGLSSPSGQAEVLPDGSVRMVSTHEQILGPGGAYIGAIFPAHSPYRRDIQEKTLAIGRELSRQGLVGRFAVDFMATSEKLIPIEINIRLGATTTPILTAVGLTGAQYDEATGRLLARGRELTHDVIDHHMRPGLVGISSQEFLEFFNRPENQDVLFDHDAMEGVVFHMIPAVGLKGNVAYVLIATSEAAKARLRARLMHLLDRLEAERKI